jgi:hypothetical protein
MQYRILFLILSGLLILTACNAFPAAAPTPTMTFPFIPTTAVPSTPAPDFTPIPTSSLDYNHLLSLFNYDPSLPLELEIISEEQYQNMIVQTLRYTGGMNGEVPTSLVMPPGDGPFPAVIYLHAGGLNRSQFLVEAVALVEMGVASLLIDSPLVGKPWGGEEFRPDFPADIRELVIRQVLDVRRGLDLLATLPQIDMGRIALVGHNSGASFGGVVTGIESRIKCYVLIGGTALFSETISPDGGDIPRMDDLDAVHYVPHAAPAALLFQFAEFNQSIERSHVELFYNAASQHKEVRWYNATILSIPDHSRTDRLNWLSAQLGFDYIP